MKEIKDFFTLKKYEYSFFSKKNVLRSHRLYNWNNLLCTAKYICPLIDNDFSWFKTQEINFSFEWEYRQTQKDIMNTVVARYNKKYNCWLIKLKTWWWKTIIQMWLITYFKAPTLILCNSTKMLEETIDKYEQFLWFRPAAYYWKKKETWFITVSTHRTFTLSGWKIPWFEPEIIMYDECHLSIGKPMIKALCSTKAKALYWFSWTPETKDYETKDLELIFWKVIEPKADNYFYIPKFEFIDFYTNYRYEADTTYADLRTAMTEYEWRQKKQIREFKRIIIERNWPILLLSDRVWEIDFFEEELKNYNIVKIVWWTKEADLSLKEWRSRFSKTWEKMIIMWTVWCLSVWFDFPAIDTVCMFQPIKIRQSVIQSIWRALRHFEWKTDVLVCIWQDMILRKQRSQKITAIKSEYWDNVEIVSKKIKEDVWEKWKVAFEI